jgi:hypothetical protein
MTNAVVLNLRVEILRYVSDRQPGVVSFEFADAAGCWHRFIDKVPVVSLERLSAADSYPRSGVLRCEELSRWQDFSGREIVHMITSSPDGVASMEGHSEFLIFADQLEF